MDASPRPWNLSSDKFYKTRTLFDANGRILIHHNPVHPVLDIVALNEADWLLIEQAGSIARMLEESPES